MQITRLFTLDQYYNNYSSNAKVIIMTRIDIHKLENIASQY